MQKNKTIYHRCLGKGGFLGVDFSSAPYQTDPARLSMAVNLWHDYGGEMGGFLETFPGLRCVAQVNRPIHGLFLFHPPGVNTPFLIIHAGACLFSCEAQAGAMQLSLRPIAEGLSERESTAFVLGGQMGILDGERYRLLSFDREAHQLILTPADDLYTPITYADNLPYEQRNALSVHFKELWHLPYTEGYGDGEMGNLVFEIMDTVEKTCRLVGTKTKTSIVRVPAMAHIDGQVYRVKEIGERAFQNNNVLEVLVIEEGVETIGRYAVNTCLSLVRVSLPSSMCHLQKACFAYCEALEEVHFGEHISQIDDHAFYRCPALSHVSYGGSQAEWESVVIGTNNENLTDLTLTYETAGKIYARCYRLTVHEKCAAVTSVLVANTPLPEKEYVLTKDVLFNAEKTYYTALGIRYIKASPIAGDPIPQNIYYEKHSLWYEAEFENAEGESLLCALYIYAEDGRALPQAVCTLEGILSERQFSSVKEAHFGGITQVKTGDAIHRCTLCAVFDGRVFFAGSPDLPNTVFYAHRTRDGHIHPAYFGICNYMEDGTSNAGFTALCATPTALFLFKGENAAEGTVYCHTPKDTNSSLLPRIYPATSGMVADGSVGGACHFADDTVFLSKRGLASVDKSSLSGERGISHRSYLVDNRLSEEDLTRTRLLEWQGYLLLLCPNGHGYMADSRLLTRHKTGEVGYEWVYLEGLGGYSEDIPVYRLASAFPACAVSCQCGSRRIGIAEEHDALPFGSYEAYEAAYPNSVFSAELTFTKENGTAFSATGEYAKIQDQYYLLYPTEEKTGGRFAPATVGCAIGDLLFLGTAEGHLLLANTDLRGAAYEHYPPPPSYAIDRHYYHICRHRIESLAVTIADNGDFPTMTKTTMKKATVIDTKALSGGRVTVMVATDKTDFQPIGVYTEGQMNFEDTDLFSFVFSDKPRGQAVFLENTKRWSYKQYALFSKDYQRPFGIGQLSYRYRVEGRMKPE